LKLRYCALGRGEAMCLSFEFFMLKLFELRNILVRLDVSFSHDIWGWTQKMAMQRLHQWRQGFSLCFKFLRMISKIQLSYSMWRKGGICNVTHLSNFPIPCPFRCGLLSWHMGLKKHVGFSHPSNSTWIVELHSWISGIPEFIFLSNVKMMHNLSFFNNGRTCQSVTMAYGRLCFHQMVYKGFFFQIIGSTTHSPLLSECFHLPWEGASEWKQLITFSVDLITVCAKP
jgi:hypothetical protein